MGRRINNFIGIIRNDRIVLRLVREKVFFVFGYFLRSSVRGGFPLLGFFCLMVSASCVAQGRTDGFEIQASAVSKQANNALALMAFAVTPDLTSSFLTISRNDGRSNSLAMTQLSGGATVAREVPIYLEGGIGYIRYDPEFVATRGAESREIPARWNIATLNGGVGFDFKVAENWVFRPIVNFSLGQAASDVSLAARYLNWRTDNDISFLDGGKLNAIGLGGSLMLDYESVTSEREIDVEIRYTNVKLRSFGDGVAGYARAEALSVYARRRTPTGISILGRPLRLVLEGAHTTYLGSQRGLLGFNYLTSVGGGLEIDTSKYLPLVSRARLVGRFAFGENVRGFDVGMAISF